MSTGEQTKTIVITGASDGIGAAAARRLAERGHRLVLVGRSPEKTRRIGAELDSPAFAADFADLSEVRALAARIDEEVDAVDVLVNNAGGVFGDRTPTVDGFEKTLQVDHLAPFLLTNLLMPSLLAARACVITTSSAAARLFGDIQLDDLQNERRFSANKAYGDAKLANILFTKERIGGSMRRGCRRRLSIPVRSRRTSRRNRRAPCAGCTRRPSATPSGSSPPTAARRRSSGWPRPRRGRTGPRVSTTRS